MVSEEYKITTGKHQGKMLKDIPASYLLYCYDNGYMMDRLAMNYVEIHEKELRIKAEEEN